MTATVVTTSAALSQKKKACLKVGRAGFSQIEAVSTVETLCFTKLVNATHFGGQSKAHEMAIPQTRPFVGHSFEMGKATLCFS